MAAESLELREIPYLRLFPWIRLLRAVRVAIDGKKMILAALGLALSVVGWGVLDLCFPDSSAIKLQMAPDPLPSLVGSGRSVGETLRDAFLTVADPPRVLMAPFRAFFYVQPAAGQFWHATFSALWAALVWGIIGGAIARVAVVQVATGERVSLTAALRFAVRKGFPLIVAPLSPFLGVFFFTAWCALLGLLYRIPSQVVLTILGVLAFLPLLAGLVMSIILAGLAAGWPLMHVTVAAEGEDVFDALSRSYAYVYQRPTRYAAYVLLAWAIGAVGLLIVSLFAHAVVQLAIWAISIGAPDTLLVDLFKGGSQTAGTTAGAIHSGWLTIVALLAYGWVYSYFWTAASIIYLLLRHDVDGTEWHDIILPPGPGHTPAQAGPGVAEPARASEPEGAPVPAGAAEPPEAGPAASPEAIARLPEPPA